MRRAASFDRRTKIVCTIGPATGSVRMIEKLIKAGMNVARLNLSHGTVKEHASYVQTIRDASRHLNTVVAILMDLPGPKYRTGKLKDHRAVLKKGTQFSFTTEQINGDATKVSVNLPYLSRDVKPGDTVLLDDGAMELTVQQVHGSEVRCRVKIGGILTEERGLVVPGMHHSGPFITYALREALLFAINSTRTILLYLL